MSALTRLARFNRCLKGPWITSGHDVQWRFRDNVLTFQCTRSRTDWLHNIFAVKMDHEGDMVHAGYAILWESVRFIVDNAVGEAENITIEGFSQGAALATLAYRHYYLQGKNPKAYVFGSPKVFASKTVMPELENIQVHGDLVTLLPPWFQHAGTRIRLGIKPLIPSFRYHEPDIYRSNL